jgi:Flp pilus assembly pilin Flp
VWTAEGRIVLKRVVALARDEDGQDLVEYSLLLTFVCLVGAAMFVSMGSLTSGIWSIVNSRMAASNQSS